MASSAISIADSLAIDGLYSSAIDAYTEAICLSDDRASSNAADEPQASAITTEGSNNNGNRTDNLTLRFLALSHRSSAYLATNHYRAAFNDAKEALGLIDTNRYDFLPANAAASDNGKKLRYEQVAITHDRAAQSLLALNKKDGEVKVHWENALTLAAMGENESLVDRYQNCLEMLNDGAEQGKDKTTSESEKPVVEDSKAPISVAANTVSTPAPAALSNSTQPPKYQYYQDSSWMKIQILEPNLSAETCLVSITPESLSVSVVKNGVTHTIIHGDLPESVVVDRCRTLYKDEKVIIKLKKVNDGEWSSLIDKKTTKKAKVIKEEEKVEAQKEKDHPSVPRPYASDKDWEAIERDLKQQEENESPEVRDNMCHTFLVVNTNPFYIWFIREKKPSINYLNKSTPMQTRTHVVPWSSLCRLRGGRYWALIGMR